MNPCIRVTIPAKAEYVDVVRLALFGVAHKAGFAYEEIEDMKVAVSEACTNAILHAYAGGRPGEVDIRFELLEAGLSICVKDEGASFEYAHAGGGKPSSPRSGELSELAPGGLGLFMMHALMDHVEVRTGSGTEVILTKRIARKEEMT
ncbi:anti-sigma B factor RsbW [Paenibacillus arenilitoris]|uniref:Anti-sigma B factor RsbW n=1 Tax=Paenibacillus arenilitoris TaxID=2772299 RepID=A0A927CH60_9BACL|nr:anti-sigma B factor RsbW [Paenibacillus arenilitoris]MBD2868018.1 anti-sigma B factor RsbW [Paenibacillus arenilitoris]